MNALTYTKADQEDIQTLIDLRVEFLEGLLGPQAPEAVTALREQLEQYFTKALSDNTYICYVAKSNNSVVGVGGIILRAQPGTFKNPSGKTGYLVNMYTVPGFRKKGICKTLLELLTHDATASGITAFELHATKEGEPVYRQNGFEMHHEPTYRKYLKLQ